MNMPPVLTKRVAGVPVLYIAGGVVAVLAVYAWRTKASATGPVATDTAGSTAEASSALGGEAYPQMETGTVVVQPALPVAAGPGNPTITSNDDWVAFGVAFLGKQGVAGGEAQMALQTYIDGGQLSYGQGQLRDRVIAEYGVPPIPTSGGETSAEVPTNVSGEPLYYVKRPAPSLAIYAVYPNKTRVWVKKMPANWYTAPLDSVIWTYPVIGADRPGDGI
jgi:hypothetical protein